MRRLALYGFAAVILLCLVVTVLKITGRPPAAMSCSNRGAVMRVSSQASGVHYACSCGHQFSQPASGALSWMDAVEDAIVGPTSGAGER